MPTHRATPAATTSMAARDETGFLMAGGRRLEYRWFGDAPTTPSPIVLLHEGLGSVALWRDFPTRLAEATGRAVLAYSRQGYGRSDPPAGPRTVGFMHDEAHQVLPEVLAALGIERPLLVGHSDGASIALLHAAQHPGVASGVVALAPHLFVEPLTTRSIAELAARFEESDLPQRMQRYHADPLSTFRGWAGVWLDPAFPGWNIETQVARVRCPILAMQGSDDEYGTMGQVHRIAQLQPSARVIEIRDCGHSPHVDAMQRVLDEIRAFANDLP
jgi:pimeloyl-ACP methyl ester carboxylesterase